MFAVIIQIFGVIEDYVEWLGQLDVFHECF